jgi:hypothetical protein
MNNNFNKDEIVIMRRKNKRTGKTEERQYPIVGGRLRLFHEDLENRESVKERWGVKTEIQKYENDVAVVTAVVTIEGNQFTGIGMASKQRDSMIFPAILEMAETRAIARALRFAGYGVEYTGWTRACEIPGGTSRKQTACQTGTQARAPGPGKPIIETPGMGCRGQFFR